MLCKSSFKNKLLTLSTLIFCSAQYDAYGMKGDEVEDIEKAPRRSTFQVVKTGEAYRDGLPSDVLKLMLARVSRNGIDPRILERVCKYWYMSMRYRIPEAGAPTLDKAGIPYTSKMNDLFMEDCMKSYMEYIVSNCVLYYKKGEAGKEQELCFQNGTANLTDCGDLGNHLVYTLREDRLREIGGANENKLVTFFGPFHKMRHLLPADAKGAVDDVVAIWKWGNDMLHNTEGKVLFDYRVTRALLLCKENMYENWKKSRCRHMAWWHALSDRGRGGCFMLICEPKLDVNDENPRKKTRT